MKNRQRIKKIIVDTGVIAIVRSKNIKEVSFIINSLMKGGVIVIEISMTSTNAINLLKEVTSNRSEKLIIGMGTVLDAATAKICLEIGAEFIVSPTTDLEVIRIAHEYEVPVIPGAFSPNEILRANLMNADFVKLFPAGILGPTYMQTILKKFPQISIIPTGNITIENTKDFISKGAAAVGVGSKLVTHEAIMKHDQKIITNLAKSFIEEVNKGRKHH